MATGEHRRTPTYQELMREFGEKGEVALGFERLGDSVIVRAEKIPPEPELEKIDFSKSGTASQTHPRQVAPQSLGGNGLEGRIAAMEGELEEMGRKLFALRKGVSQLRAEMNGKRKRGLGTAGSEPNGSATDFGLSMLLSGVRNIIRERKERAEREKFREFQRKLFVLTYDGPHPMAKICEFTGVGAKTASAYLKRMAEQGLIFERRRRGERLFGIRR